MITINQTFDFFNREYDTPFITKQGSNSVILSAPHCYTHYRNDRAKVAEKASGVISKILSDYTSCYSIVKSQVNLDDPNFTVNSPYKKFLAKFIKDNNIKFMLDLHELRADREQEINLLTYRLRQNSVNDEIIQSVTDIFNKYNFSVIENIPYAGKSVNNLSNFIARNCDIFTLQIEMNSKFLYPELPDYRLIDMIKAIYDITLYLDNKK